jgi:hypothetical protein
MTILRILSIDVIRSRWPIGDPVDRRSVRHGSLSYSILAIHRTDRSGEDGS